MTLTSQLKGCSHYIYINFSLQQQSWGEHRSRLVCSSVLLIHQSVIILWFSCISRQMAKGIDLKLGRYIHPGTPHIWLKFGHAPLNSDHFLASDLSNSFVHFQTNCWSRRSISNFLDTFIMVLPELGCRTFSHAPLNSHRFLAYYWSSSFHAFADKPLMKLS